MCVTTTMRTLYMWHEVVSTHTLCICVVLSQAIRDMHVGDSNSIWEFYSLVISIFLDPPIVLSLSFSLALFLVK